LRNIRFRLLVFCASVVGMFLGAASLSWAQGQSNVVVVKATKHVFAPPLSQLVPSPSPAGQMNSFEDPDDDDRLPAHEPSATRPVRSSVDSVLQGAAQTSLAAATVSTTSGLNFLGVGYGFPGYSNQAIVSDSNAAVGSTQLVQFVNRSFEVFNKSTGALAYGPITGYTLWQALGAPCDTGTTYSDEIAQFDKLANRWVLMMPVWSNPNQLCVAVSTTSDATNGGWNLYVFPTPKGDDYPKLAVWPDGYYIVFDQSSDLVFTGVAACVLDRNSMLNGAAATMQCFTKVPSSYGVMLPGDLDGTTPPPTGSPDYFLNFDYGTLQSLDLWQFHVDWTTPANTWFGTSSTNPNPTSIPVAAYTEACGETAAELSDTTGACIPQTGTAQGLDSYGDRLMYRLAYRNFGTYQALVANHTVTIGTSSSQTGIRWYELQNTGSGFGLYQQGTYAPDSNYRWMGSIAMDKAGDIALGYSVSSATMDPSIRYTGRVPTDPLGTMEGEIDLLSAAGVSTGPQTNTYRWGDYSSMAIDSADDCTFWYTAQYQASGAPHWSTRLASFSFPSCTQTSTLTVSEVGQGTVTSSDGQIDCVNGSGSCSAVYADGTAVTLTATAASTWTFSGWSGACSGTNPCQVTMNSNLSATATFTSSNYTLTVSEAGQGTVTSTGGPINCTNGSGTCSAVYASGTAVTLTATAASGWTFSAWSGPCAGANPCKLVMNTNLNPKATFTANTPWAIVNKAGKGGVTSLTIPATGSGHLIAVALMFTGATSVASISDNASNTYASTGARGVSGNWSTEIWYAVNSKAGATVVTPTFAGSAPSVQMAVWEVSGLSAAAPDAKNASTGTLTLSNTPGAAVTTTLVGDFVVSIMLASTANLSSITSGNGFTDDFTLDGNGWAHITSTSATAGTQQASWFTAAPSGIYISSTAAFHH
jgi:hypothetical protein